MQCMGGCRGIQQQHGSGGGGGGGCRCRKMAADAAEHCGSSATAAQAAQLLQYRQLRGSSS
jgi:hypothetical protein